MCDIICQQDKFRLTHKTIYEPTGWEGSVGLPDGCDPSKWLKYCYKFKFIWSAEIKKTKDVFMWIYVGHFMFT